MWSKCHLKTRRNGGLKYIDFIKPVNAGESAVYPRAAANPRLKQGSSSVTATGCINFCERGLEYPFPVIFGCDQNAVREVPSGIRCKLPGLAGSQRSLNLWPRRGGGTCHGVESCRVV
jgi:hypothetical protein